MTNDNKPLPSKCPQCDAHSPWALLTLELPGCDSIWQVKGYFCRYCAYAAELFQDTETLGRRKFLPVDRLGDFGYVHMPPDSAILTGIHHLKELGSDE